METINDFLREMGVFKMETTTDSAAKMCETVTGCNGLQDSCKQSSQGNGAKLRETVEAVVKVGYPHNFQREAPHIRGYCYEITKAIEKCFDALTAPPRNCDVGTAVEQSSRFDKFCFAHRTYERGCGDCPLCGEPCCELAWAQMPYSEGDNNANK